MRANSVVPPVMIGRVWISPTSGMRLHRENQRDQRVAAHDAVGVQDQELRVGPAEPANPFGDVARFAREVLGAMAIEDPVRAPGPFAQVEERLFLLDPDLRDGGVAQDEDVEGIARVAALRSSSSIASSPAMMRIGDSL